MLSRFLLALVLAVGLSAAAAQQSWTLRHQTTGSGFLWSITEGPGGIVAVGTDGKILHSLDGRTWTQRTSGTTNWLVAVTYGNGRYVTVGDNGTILVSADGVTWTRAVAPGTTARLNNVLFGYDRFVAVGERGTIVTSLDGTTWRPNPVTGAGSVGWLRGLAFSRVGNLSIWVATGEKGMRVNSLGGDDWQAIAPFEGQPTADWEALVLTANSSYAGLPLAEFLAVGSNGQALRLNNGGNTMTFIPAYRDAASGSDVRGTGSTARLRSLVTGNGVFLATGENGTILSAQSPNGPWTKLNIDTTKNLVGGAFVQGTLVLVGEDETILQSEPIYVSRLGNVSTRGVAANADRSMIVGTVIQGTRPKQVLVRGVGPSLAQFGVSGVMSSGTLSVFDGANKLVATNSAWTTNVNATAIASAAASVGAFPLAANSQDMALLLTLSPGNYTFQVASANGNPGNVLVEAYDLDAMDGKSSHTANLSTRGLVGVPNVGDGLLTAGLVVQGKSSRTLLIRGVGPTLGQFGVAGALSDPRITVVAQNGAIIATNDNWTDPVVVNGRTIGRDDLAAAATAAGAFPLAAGSKDAALLVTLLPGSYTVQVGGVNNSTGVALVEAYDIPSGVEFAPESPLDMTFQLTPPFDSRPLTAAELPDGRILVGGNFTFASGSRTQHALARLGRDGARDDTFAPAAIDGGTVSAIAVQPDGKILIGGSFASVGGAQRYRLARLNADGSLDSSFTTETTAAFAPVDQILIDGTGRILVLTGGSIRRFNADGSRDATWNGGTYGFAYGPGTQIGFATAPISKMALRPDGRISAAASASLLGFNVPVIPPTTYRFLCGFGIDGAVDSSLGVWSSAGSANAPLILDLRVLADGTVLRLNQPAGITPTAAAIAPDGSSWLAGRFSAPRLHLAHYNRDGSVRTFHLDNGFLGQNSAEAPPTFLLPLNDGSVLAIGDFTRVDGAALSQMARLRAN